MCWPRGGPEFERKSDYGLLWTLYDKINVQKEVHLKASRPKSDPQIVACADADLGNEEMIEVYHRICTANGGLHLGVYKP